jgi:hypothetical protein
MLVDNSVAKWDEPVQAPSPQAGPGAPSPQPSAPKSPQPQQPQEGNAPQQPSAPAPAPESVPSQPAEKKFVIKNGSDLQAWLDKGWTKELMIKNNHAHYE